MRDVAICGRPIGRRLATSPNREAIEGKGGRGGRTLRRMLKKAVQQGRNERRGEGVCFGTLSF
jgi:hypothetical protein